MPESKTQVLRTTAILAFFAAGVIHLLLAPEHLGHSPVHGIFFVAAGILEISWAGLYWRKPSPALNTAGMALAGGLLVLWGLTRLAAPPFESTPAPVDFNGVLCKLCELAGFISLLAMRIQAGKNGLPARSAARVAGAAALLALLSGLLVYGAGRAMEGLFPALSDVDRWAWRRGKACRA